MFIDPDVINKTFQRIKSELSSINFQVGKVIPKNLSIFLPIITELRLLFLSPLIIIAKDNEGKDLKFNILKEELQPLHVHFLQSKNFPLGDTAVNDIVIQAEFNENFGKKFLNYRSKKQWDNCNLNYIDCAIILRFNSTTCMACSNSMCPIKTENKHLYIWIFGNRTGHNIELYSEKEEKETYDRDETNIIYPPNFADLNFAEIKHSLKLGFCTLIKNFNTEIFSKDENEKEELRKDLFPISKYNSFFLKENELFENNFHDFDIFFDKLKNTTYFKVIYDFFDDIYLKAVEILNTNYRDNYSLHFIATDSDFDKSFIFPTKIRPSLSPDTQFDSFLRYFRWNQDCFHWQGLSNYIHYTNHPDFTIKWVMKRDGQRQWSSDVRIPYIADLLSMLGVDHEDIVSYENFQLPCVYSFWNFMGSSENKRIFVDCIKKGIEKYKRDDIAYDKVNSILSKILESEDKDTIRIYIVELIGKCKHLFFLEKLLEKLEHYSNPFIYPIYNFTFNSTILHHSQDNLIRLRAFFHECNDIVFNILFAAGFVQKEQNELFRSHLFEEAADTFKLAMDFPLDEPDKK